MGRRTSVYLTSEDLDRIRALGFPPLPEVIRAGLAVLENWPDGPAQDTDDSQLLNGGPAHGRSGSHASNGGPAVEAVSPGYE